MALLDETGDAPAAKALDEEWPPDNLFMARFLVLFVLYTVACCVAAIAVVGALHHAVHPSLLGRVHDLLVGSFAHRALHGVLFVGPIFLPILGLHVKGLNRKTDRDKLLPYDLGRVLLLAFWWLLSSIAIDGLIRHFEFLLQFGDLEDTAVDLARAMVFAFGLVFLIVVTSIDLRPKS